MSIETKIFVTIRMYLQAYEKRFTDPDMLQKWAKRANALYAEMHETKYNMTYVRERLFFNMSGAETGYYFIEELRKYFRTISRV